MKSVLSFFLALCYHKKKGGAGMERMDVYRSEFVKTGRVVPRYSPIGAGENKMVVFACIFSTDGRLLIQQRSAEKSMGGHWDVSAGGAVQAGESSRDAVARETAEELGLNLPKSAFVKLLTLYYEGHLHDIYAARWDGKAEDLSLQAGEVSAAKWVTEEEVLAMIDSGEFLPVHKEFIALLFKMQTKQGIM